MGLPQSSEVGIQLVVLVLQIGICLTAGLAAWYWYRSTCVVTPKSFEIVVPSTYGMTMAMSDDLQKLANALRLQSRLNAKAALWAAASAVLSGVAVALTAHS